jgi:hypothetical protein
MDDKEQPPGAGWPAIAARFVRRVVALAAAESGLCLLAVLIRDRRKGLAVD